MGPHVDGEILINFKKRATVADREKFRSGMNATKVKRFHSGAEQWHLPPGQTTEKIVERYRKHPLVEFVEPNYLIQAETLPDDLQFVSQYALKNTGQDGGVPGADIGTEMAWDVTTGSHDVLVAVTDTGIDFTHPDLAANIFVNPGEIAGNRIDDDMNGFVDDIHGWSFVHGSNDPSDDNGHGTHVSGILGAVGDNGVGIAGVSWKVRLLPLKFLASNGGGTTAGAIGAIDYAVDIGAQIINASWGGDNFSQALFDAIDRAGAAGVLFVASAGNSGRNIDNSPSYPAAFDLDNIIAVAATDRNDHFVFPSNFGPLTVDLGAPGVDVLSTLPFGAFGVASGTSMAAPHVSGAAALILSVQPELTALEIKDLILGGTDPLPALENITVSGGRLNVFNALATPDAIPPSPVTDLAAAAASSNSLLLTWTAPGDDGADGIVRSYDIRFSTKTLDATTFNAASRATASPVPVPAGQTQTVELTGLAAGTTYQVAVKGKDDWANSGPFGNVALATTLPAPTVATAPDALSLSLFTGETARATLTVENVGLGTLDWSLPEPFLADATGEMVPGVLTAGPTAGRLLAGESASVTLTLDAAGLAPGSYTGLVDVFSNDPATPLLRHPLQVGVASGAAIAVSPASLDFGPVLVGNTQSRTLRIDNIGSEALVISDIPSTTADLSLQTMQLIIPAGEARSVEITFAPSAAGPLDAFVSPASNAPNGASLTIPVTGEGVPAPAIAIAPAALSETLFTGQTVTRPVQITNTGASDLVVDLDFERALPSTATVASWTARAKGDETNPTAPVPAPDFFGYTYLDSTMAGGPAFSWIDIRDTGTAVDLSGDDVTSAPVEIGFDFPFYGSAFDALQVSTNGWVSFTSSLSSFSNPDELPNQGPEVPENLIAPFFDDLDFDRGSRVSVLHDGTRCIIQYSDVNRVGGGADLTFEIILYRGGRIVFQYLDTGGITDSATVGIQSGTRESGLTIASNTTYLTDGLAVTILPPLTLTNPGFETGDFDGWTTTVDGPQTPASPWAVGRFGAARPRNAPLEGFFDAFNPLSGQNGALTYVLSQEIHVPLGTVQADLSFSDRLQFFFDQSGLPRIYEATITDLAGNVLAEVAREVLEGAPGSGPFPSLNLTDLGWQLRTVDLVPFAEQTVRVEMRITAPDVSDTPFVIHPLALAEFDDFRLEAAQLPEWAHLSTLDLVIPPGETRTVDVTFDAGMADDTTFSGSLRLDTNVPSRPLIRVPVSLEVSGGPDLEVSGDRLDFGDIFVGRSMQRRLIVSNTGVRPLDVSDIVFPDADLVISPTTFSVPPGGSQQIVFTLTPTAEKTLSGAVTLHNNDPDSPVVTLPVSGQGILPPVVSVAPAFLTASLPVGTTQESTLTVANLGTGLLEFDLALEPANTNVVRVGLTSGSVEPGGSLVIPVVFDATGQMAGARHVDVVVHSNDPDEPSVLVPVDLTLIGSPDLAVGGDEIQIDASAPFTEAGARTVQTLSLPATPASQMAIVVTAFADIVTIRPQVEVEGLTLGTVGSGLSGCGPHQRTFLLSPAETAAVAADGLVEIAVTNGADSEPTCPINRHDVSARFRPEVTALDFGPVSVGGHHSRTLHLENLGTDTLTISSIASSEPRFVPEAATLDLAPGATTDLEIAIFPDAISTVSGELTLLSNDPDTPSVMIALTGQGVAAPSASLSPVAIDVTLLLGESASRILTLTNGGPGDLDFSLDGPVPLGSVTPSSGNVPAGSSMSLVYQVSTTAAAPGRFPGELRLATNDPLAATIVVPIEITVVGIPDIRLAGQSVRLLSFFFRSSNGVQSEKDFDVPVPPGTAPVFEMLSTGNPASDTSTRLSADGRVLGSVSDTGTCGLVTRDFTLPLEEAARLFADGRVTVELTETISTQNSCSRRKDHFITLTYLGRTDELDFGDVFTGTGKTRSVTVMNPGTALLSVQVETDDPAFATGVETLDLLPGDQTPVSVVFTPPTTGAHEAVLLLSTNDPDQPEIRLPLHARGLVPPELAVEPAAINTSVPVGEDAAAALLLRNDGGSPLRFQIVPTSSLPQIDIQPDRGAVDAGASIPIQLTVRTASDPVGLVKGTIRITTNDPAHPVMNVPIAVTITGTPDLLIGDPLTVSSQSSFSLTGGSTHHALPLPASLAGPVDLAVTVTGDFDRSDEFATVHLESAVIGTVGDLGCIPSGRTFHLDAETVASLASDGVIEVDVTNSGSVGLTACLANTHQVSLTVLRPVTALDFGVVVVGDSVEKRLEVKNLGDDLLRVDPVGFSSPEFVGSASSLAVAPGGSAMLDISFAPAIPGAANGVLSLTTNDPDTPQVDISLRGTAVPAPALVVTPATIDATVAEGGHTTTTVTVSNPGNNTLEFALAAQNAPFVAVDSTLHTLAPDQTVDLEVDLDARGLNAGSFAGNLIVTSNDPRAPHLEVPITLTIQAAPDVELSAAPVQFPRSTRVFTAGSTTHHLFPVIEPIGGDGQLTLTLVGLFRPGDFVQLFADGVSLGGIIGQRSFCSTVRKTFSIDEEVLQAIAADHLIDVSVVNSPLVFPSCFQNLHQVELEYTGSLTPLDFGTLVTVGDSATRTVHISNQGSQPLQVLGAIPSAGSFTVSPETLTVAAGATAPMEVTFTLDQLGTVDEQLVLQTNDPDEMAPAVSLHAVGQLAASLAVEPALLSVSLAEIEQTSRTLTLINDGDGPLTFQLVLMPGGQEQVVLSGSAGIVPPHGSLPVTVTVNSRGLALGRTDFVILVASNDPVRPRLNVPLQVTSVAVPHILVSGEGAADVSTVDFTTAGATTSHAFALDDLPAGLATVQVVVDGNFRSVSERASIFINSVFRGVVGGSGASCTPHKRTITLSTRELVSLARDGDLHVDIVNSPAILPSCPVNRHTVSFTARPPVRSIDLGDLFENESGTATVNIENLGSRVLNVAIATPPGITAAPPVFNVGRNKLFPVTLTLTENSPGPVSRTVVVNSNDLINPHLSLPVTAVVVEPPVARVTPAALDETLFAAQQVSRSLVLSNDGTAALTYTVGIQPEDSLVTSSGSGTIPPGGSTLIGVDIDTGRLAATGTFQAEVQIATNDPRAAMIRVPVRVVITSGPRLLLASGPLSVESRVSFPFSFGAMTSHSLAVPPDLLPGTRLVVTAIGDFGAFNETARVELEGTVLGTIGTNAADCVPFSTVFQLDPALVATAAADGLLEVTVSNTSSVAPSCSGLDEHRVRVEGHVPASSLDLGEVLVGNTVEATFGLFNAGNAELNVLSFADVASDLTLTPQTLTVPPGATGEVMVRFAPSAAGPLPPALRVVSDDPVSPRVDLSLLGAGLAPPAANVDPGQLAATVDEGQIVSETLTVSNTGGSDLVFDVDVDLLPPDAVTATSQTLSGPGGSPSAAARPVALQPLAPTPVPMTGLVVDPASGILYGQAFDGVAFFRYDPSVRVWEPLASAPLPARRGAAASVLDGKIYLAYVGTRDVLLVYDIANDAWAVRTHPAPAVLVAALAPGAMAGDGVRFLYIAIGRSLLRFDSTSGGTVFLAGLPLSSGRFILQEAGMALHDGSLYVVGGTDGFNLNRPPVFLRYDIATDTWTKLDPPPFPGDLGAVVDPITREFVVTDQDHLMRYSLDEAVWSVTDLPFFAVTHGGVAWLGAPVPGVVVAQGRDGPGFARMLSGPAFIRVEPASGSVAPGNAVDVSVILDARRLRPAAYNATLTLRSNDPVTPALPVSASLTVQGVPDIAIAPETVTVQSVASFDGPGASTTHRLPVASPPVGDLTVRLAVDGDFGDPGEVATVSAGSLDLGPSARGLRDCRPSASAFVVSPDDLAGGALAGGFLDLTVTNSDRVSSFCPRNEHAVTLLYGRAVEQLDFGTASVGFPTTRSVTLLNQGHANLHLLSLSASADGLQVPSAPVVIPPGGRFLLPTTFTPTAAGVLAATLTITSDDPDQPVIPVALRGEAILPPRITVEPVAVETALPPRSSLPRTRTAVLRNDGLSDLVWQLDTLATIAAAGGPAPGDWLDLAKDDESANGTGALTATRFRGPDPFGYTATDSDEPGGPAFSWVDVSAAASPLLISGDDTNSGPVAIGFGFPFYGEVFDTVNVSSNGWLSFTSTRSSFSNPDRLPNTGFSVPENLLAPFFDDLDLGGKQSIEAFADGDRFVIQFNAVARHTSGGDLTFQVILYPDGRILFQYLTLSGILDSATVGIQNGEKTSGLLVAYNEPYLHDALAVEFRPRPEWLEADPTSGVVSPGTEQTLTLTLTTRDLDDADVFARLDLTTNDPAHPVTSIPVTLHSRQVDLDQFAIEPGSLNLGSMGQTVRASLQLPAPFNPHDIVIDSVSIDGKLFANPAPVEFTDADGDGREEIGLKFDRQAFIDLLPDGEQPQVTITGEVRDQTWFIGSGSVRALRPKLLRPRGGELVLAGGVYDVAWEPLPMSGSLTYDVLLSVDDGATWSVLAAGLTKTSHAWPVSGPDSRAARIRVIGSTPGGAVGSDTSDETFAITTLEKPPHAVSSLRLTRANDATQARWMPPAVDPTHDAARAYRLEAASRPEGPFTPVASTAALQFPVAEPVDAGAIVFYRVIAANTGGDAIP
ncbi:MAG: choice-of-anchor D domain-containing protein [Acidobacteriota bacterium]